MVFVKVQKTKAYFKNFQVKPRRRRECKTDYQARRGLVTQELSKYGSPKYRLVVRRTNHRILCQVVYSTLTGDRIIASADSFELPEFGVDLGLTNYAAAYCTGLLCARRLLKSLNLDSMFEGVKEVNGEEFHIENEAEERRPFKAVLDIGLVRTTTGNRVFGAMKGAVDGGLHVPHSTKRFPGYDKEAGSYNAEAHRDRIFGEHVAQYMRHLQENDPDKYETHFSKYIKQGITPDAIPEMYRKCHQAIRDNPDRRTEERAHPPVCKREGSYIKTSNARYYKPQKLTCAERHERVHAKLAIVAQKAVEAAEQESDEE